MVRPCRKCFHNPGQTPDDAGRSSEQTEQFEGNHEDDAELSDQRPRRSDSMDSTPRNEPVIPEQEKHQPDPMLQMSVGRMSGGAMTLAAIVAAVVLGVVFYGLSSPNRTEQAPPSPAAQSAHPQSGGQPGPASPGAPRANESGTKG
jgi:negative regulator of sigma E activity